MIPENLFLRKSKVWRSELAEIEVELEPLREATESYHEEGLKLLELAQIAHQRYLALPNATSYSPKENPPPSSFPPTASGTGTAAVFNLSWGSLTCAAIDSGV